jgi:APA family basic amino acid/polyamine antiporter
VALRPELLGELHRVLPPLSFDAWAGIASASLLSFFAFIGFEDIVNVAEEVRQPHRTLPRAIVATLLVATMLYVAVVTVVTLAVPPEALRGSAAPLALVFQSAGGHVGLIFMAIAVFATINGVLVQMIMASRVLYGLAAQGNLPSALGSALAYVSPVTRTPALATAFVVAATAVLAVAFPISGLAEVTSQIVLAAFTLVNLSLVCIKLRGETHEGFRVPLVIPMIGTLSSAALLVVGILPLTPWW